MNVHPSFSTETCFHWAASARRARRILVAEHRSRPPKQRRRIEGVLMTERDRIIRLVGNTTKTTLPNNEKEKEKKNIRAVSSSFADTRCRSLCNRSVDPALPRPDQSRHPIGRRSTLRVFSRVSCDLVSSAYGLLASNFFRENPVSRPRRQIDEIKGTRKNYFVLYFVACAFVNSVYFLQNSSVNEIK